jgi:hypothetical protein
MRNSSFGTFTETKRVSTNKVSTFTIRVIQGIEKMRGGWGEDVLDVLLKCVDCFSRWVFGNLSINKLQHQFGD